jgi:hypothetical protein
MCSVGVCWESGPDSIEAWAGRYLDAAIRGVRSAEVTDKIALHLARFGDHVHDAHGHERKRSELTLGG